MPALLPSVPPPYSTIIPILIGISILAFIVGMALGKPNADRTRRLPFWAKLVMLIVVAAIAGIEWLVLATGTQAESYARWIFLGLVVGGIGDMVLFEEFNIKDALIYGMGIFAVGHILYLLAIFYLRNILYPNGLIEIAIVAIPAMFLSALLWEFIVRNPMGDRRINTASFFYGILLSVTTGFAIFFAIRSQIMILLGVGMILFLISDALLAQVAIRKRGFPSIQDVVWIIYSIGQMLIALSIIEALNLLT